MSYIRQEKSGGKTYELTQISEVLIGTAWNEMKERFERDLAKIDTTIFDEGIHVVLDANAVHERIELVGVKLVQE